MPVPALVVGLGGTGTLVATYLKKELMEMSGGRWPLKEVKVVAYDTDTRQPELGGQGQVRQGGQSTGAVRLEKGEFFPVIGSVKPLMQEVAAGKYPHIGKWLLADWYLRNLSDKQFNLNEGAGQFRQFGRLAIFRDLATPAQSTIFNTLEDALTGLSRDNPTLTGLLVFIVGSLAGGTGAGMFADIAYLIRKLAGRSAVRLADRMSIRGYLVLPDAFTQTVDASLLRSMHARAFAAMREISRFTVSFDYERGYPIHYRDGSGDPIWHSSLRGRLFDLVHYVDGNGVRSKLNAVKMEHGIAPMIADAISAAIDRESGPLFSSYLANVEAERTQRITRGELSAKIATFGSVGTYSIVFPIYQIMEGWSHDLGLAVLDTFARPDQTTIDPRSGLPKALLFNANAEFPNESGRDAAPRFLRATQPLVYEHRDSDGKTIRDEAEPTLLFGEFARIAEETRRTGSGLVQELIGRDISDWKVLFVPGGDDPDTHSLRARINLIIDEPLYDKAGHPDAVRASDQQTPKENPVEGATRIAEEVRKRKTRLLGEEDGRTGQRSGGMYRMALRQIADYHVTRFQHYLEIFLLQTLNGSPNRPASETRSGNLGYVADFLKALGEMLDTAKTTMQRVQKERRERGESRRQAIAATREALQRMQELASKKGLFGKPVNDAFRAQHAYLQAEARLVGILQTEALEDVLIETLNKMLDYVNSAQESVKFWTQTLVTASDSLYAGLLRGKKQVDSDRIAMADIKCRKVISDPEYERRRYEHYLATIEGGWLNAIMNRLEWEVQTEQRSGHRRLSLGLSLHTTETGKRALGKYNDDNLQSLLSLCREPFQQARQVESIVGYLMDHPEYRNPATLAKEIFENVSVALAYYGGNPLIANYARAFFQTEEGANHREYLREVMQAIAQHSGQNVHKFIQFASSEDRFKFTMIFTEELLELDKIDAYKHGREAYLGTSDETTKGDRRVLHIFPAEVHAAEYEAKLLRDLKQRPRLFADDLVLQLEDVEQFRRFLMCYVYDLIRLDQERDPQTNTTRFVFKLIVPPKQAVDAFGNQAQSEEIWLTKPSTEVSMLEALMTFNFVGQEVGRDETQVRFIDYEAVTLGLQRKREDDAQRRVETMDFKYNEDLLRPVRAIRDEQERQKTLLDLARIERVSQKRQYIETTTLPYWKDRLNTTPEAQKEYDLASVFLIMLNDEIKTVRNVVENNIKSLRELGELD